MINFHCFNPNDRIHRGRGWARISAYSSGKEIVQKGWVQPFYLEILTSDNPVLYNKSNKHCSVIKIKNYDYNYLDILDCHKGWLKI
jgi:hypothetical protein